MNRGLTLKCLQCDNHEFHILLRDGVATWRSSAPETIGNL